MLPRPCYLVPEPTISNSDPESSGLRIKETKEVYEGEVTELTPEEAENPLGGYGKTIANVVIGLKTTKGTKQLKLDPSIYEAIQKEKISMGVSLTIIITRLSPLFRSNRLSN